MTDLHEDDDYFINRSKKIQQQIQQGDNYYPHKFHVEDLTKDIIAKYSDIQAGEHTSISVKMAGRVMAMRKIGRLNFFKILDNGSYIQLVITSSSKEKSVAEKKDLFITFDESNFSEGAEFIKRGDIIGFEGTVGKSKKGELSIFVTKIYLLSPCLRTLPVEYFGVKDCDLLYRKRYLDLLLNNESKQRFITRSKVIKYIRAYLDERDFLEVETPMMNLIPGGAAAKPFITHHNELKLDLYMRISPELYLKQLVVGGMNRVYELGKEYRNEGIDLTHNPEFTSCEFYMAYADYDDLIKITEEMIHGMVVQLNGCEKVKYHPMKREERPDEVIIDFSRHFRKIDILDELNNKMKERMQMWTISDRIKNLVLEKASLDYLKHDTHENFELKGNNLEEMLDFLILYCHIEEITVNDPKTLPRVLDKLIGEYIEPQCINPTFVINHPLIMSPLAKKKRDDPFVTERFELFINGKEICNAYTELNDPFDQRKRFEEQVKDAEKGDDEAMKMDKGFITALEYGLPPTGGWGIGIDRLVMFLTNAANIRDVIFFPAMKPE